MKLVNFKGNFDETVATVVHLEFSENWHFDLAAEGKMEVSPRDVECKKISNYFDPHIFIVYWQDLKLWENVA